MTEPYYSDGLVALHLADCMDVLPSLPDASIDSVVTDPPYGLSELPRKQVEQALAAWLSGDRLHVPDGRGFMGAEWDKFVPPPGVWDEVYRVLKPGGYLLAFAGTRTYDLMGLSVRLAGFRVGDGIDWVYGSGRPSSSGSLKPAHEPIVVAWKTAAAMTPMPGLGGCRATAGRWPSNIVLDETAAAALDEQTGVLPDNSRRRDTGRVSVGYQGGIPIGSTRDRPDEAGGASRYFPVIRYQPKAPKSERPRLDDGTEWKTVKPLGLMRWLVRLVTPSGGTVLDCHAGTGTTGEACTLEGFRCVLIERDPAAAELAVRRLGRRAATLFDLEAS